MAVQPLAAGGTGTQWPSPPHPFVCSHFPAPVRAAHPPRHAAQPPRDPARPVDSPRRQAYEGRAPPKAPSMSIDHFIPLWIVFAFAATVGISTFL
jgi:hypothetical protein